MTIFYVKALPSHPCYIVLIITCAINVLTVRAQGNEFIFNTDVLDINDRSNINLDQFSRKGYIMPGDYMMAININKQELLEQPVTFYAPDDDPKGSEACVTAEIVDQIGLKPEMKEKLVWWHQGRCLLPSSLPGMTATGELGVSKLFLNVPQAYLEYASDNWDPPSRWDDGIPGLLFDYNVNTQAQRQQQGMRSYNLSGNGTTGANIGAWRLRADWQSRLEHGKGSGNSWDWSRFYAYRALPQLGAQLSMGENYLSSDIFDSFRFAGASLIADDNMLPPNLRGYAPEVTGVAKTNARVVISQQGRILQETQVAAGPFRIQDINGSVSGQLDVRVEEQDGSVQEFKMETASIPYLTRPGTVRYKMAAGRPNDWQHHTNGPLFATGEFSWGVSNGWSLYGGGVFGGDYNALAMGIGRDLLMFGALSVDATQSRARLPYLDETLSGGSYRLSYSKRFENYDSQVTFAGYRFSEQNYMSMSEYLDARIYGAHSQNSKEMYTITFSQEFRNLGMSAYLDYQHQTYWDMPDNDRYNLSLNRSFDIGPFRDASASVNAYRNKYNGVTDDGMYLGISIPWGNRGSLSYSSSWNRNDNTQQVSYFASVNDFDSYQLSTGTSRSGVSTSASYSHQGDFVQMNSNASYQAGNYSSLGFSFQGGATATMKGAALHRAGRQGGTRMLLDTDGVAGIPIQGYGASTKSNHFGKVVVSDVGSYYRSRVSIDLNNLPDNAEANQSVVQATLTEGAIGYRHFEVIAGEKAMAVIRLADGSYPPFGATVQNHKQQEVGIVNDGGSIYLSGMNAGEKMTVHWAGREQCDLALPDLVPGNGVSDLLLPCHRPGDK